MASWGNVMICTVAQMFQLLALEEGLGAAHFTNVSREKYKLQSSFNSLYSDGVQSRPRCQ